MRGMKMIGILLLVTLLIIFMLMSPSFAFANESGNVSKVEQINQIGVNGVLNESEPNTTGGGSGDFSNITNHDMGDIDGSNYIPDTTIEDANQWVSKKGEDLVGLGGTIAEPIAILGFMLGLFITLAGAFTKSNHVIKGLIVMAISIVVYVGAIFAPDLVHYFSTWLAS